MNPKPAPGNAPPGSPSAGVPLLNIPVAQRADSKPLLKVSVNTAKSRTQINPSPFFSLVDKKAVFRFSFDGDDSAVVERSESLSGVMNRGFSGGTVSPMPVSGFTVTNIGSGRFLFFGGIATKKSYDNRDDEVPLWFYDSTKDSWTMGKQVSGGIADRHSHAAIYKNGKFYVFGGCKGYDVTNELLIFSIDGDKYSSCTVKDDLSMPCARCHHTMTAVGNKVYVFGGNTGDGQLRGDLWEMDLSIDPLKPQWALIRKNGPSMRQQHIAFTRNGALFIAGGVGEDEEVLSDIWRFDGKEWQQVAVFDFKLTSFGCSQGLFDVDPYGQVFQLEESPTMAVLVEQFADLKGRQRIKMEKIAERWNNIGEMRVEMDRIARMMTQINEGNMTEVRDYFSESVLNTLRADIEKLREQFVSKAASVLEVHAEDFCAPSHKPPSLVDIKSQHLAAKCDRVRKKYDTRIAELKKEIQVYSGLLGRGAVQSQEKNELYSKILDFIEKQSLLERQTLRLNHQHATIKKLTAQLERNNTKVLDIIHEINDAEEEVNHRKETIQDLKEQLAPLQHAIEKSKAKCEFLNTPPELSKSLLDRAIAQSNDLRESYRQMIHDCMPMDVKNALRSLIALSNVLYEQYRKPDTLPTVQKQVRNFTTKLFTSLRDEASNTMVFESFDAAPLSPRS